MTVYRFKSFVVDKSERRLLCGGQVVPLTPKVFDTLVYLVERAGHLVEKGEILNAVWPDSIVEEVNLARSVHTLRKALGQGEDVYIETVPTKGYRFVADVELIQKEADGKALTETGSADKRVPAALPAADSRSFSRQGLKGFGIVILLGSILFAASLALILAFTGTEFPASTVTSKTDSGLAYSEYRQGRVYLDRHLGQKDVQMALEHFERAVEADPKFVDAIVGSADALMLTFWDTHSNDDIVKAMTYLENALELDDSNAYAHTVKCRLLSTYKWQQERAQQACERAVELDPDSSAVQRELGYFLNSQGRTEEALEAMRKAASIEPTSRNKRSIGVVLYHARRFDEAIAQFKQIMDTDPEYLEVLKWTRWAYEMKGDHQGAFEELVKEERMNGLAPEKIRQLRETFRTKGWKGVLRSRLDAKKELDSFRDVCDLAQLGETELAFEVLDKLMDRHAVMLVTIGREPLLDPLRSDPRFEVALKRIGLR